MNISHIPRSALILAVLLGSAAPLCAQPNEQKRPYVEFKIDPNFEKAFRDRLKAEKELGPLKDLIKKIVADPSKLPINEKDLKGLKLEDENFKQALKNWAQNDPELQKALKDWIKNNPPDKQPAKVKEFQKELAKMLKEQKPAGKEIEIKNLPVPVNPEEPKPDPVAKATERALKQAENSKLGEWLRDSPAMRRAFQDLRNATTDPKAGSFKLEDWQKRLRLPEGKLAKIGEGALERLQKLPRPELQRWNPPALPGLRNVRLPAIAAPRAPDLGTPSLPALGSGFSVILFVLLMLLAGWFLWRRNRVSAARADVRDLLGPWPVQPEAVSTRAELVLAFDYLALLTLGLTARSWNHQAVARKWVGKSPACTGPADALASLYEQARYTEGAAVLTETQRDQARRCLLQLAESL